MVDNCGHTGELNPPKLCNVSKMDTSYYLYFIKSIIMNRASIVNTINIMASAYYFFTGIILQNLCHYLRNYSDMYS